MLVKVKNLGRSVRRFRKRFDLSQERCAWIVGVSLETIRRWERCEDDDYVRTQSTFVDAFKQVYAHKTGRMPPIKQLD